MNQNPNPKPRARIPITPAERIALAMLSAAASQAAQRLGSPILCRVMDALNDVESGDVDSAADALRRPL